MSRNATVSSKFDRLRLSTEQQQDRCTVNLAGTALGEEDDFVTIKHTTPDEDYLDPAVRDLELKITKRLKELTALGGFQDKTQQLTNLEARREYLMSVLDDLGERNPGGYQLVLLKLRAGFS